MLPVGIREVYKLPHYRVEFKCPKSINTMQWKFKGEIDESPPEMGLFALINAIVPRD